ncbi:putative metal-dependent hydrolase [Anaerobacillus alkaliphilus]|uniref:Putative metal-dependent hydrolase DS745_02415 n=1 Tax=Anaerobacillus alkaliphilus TaxID=1548597 RepID=A0A4Q0VYV1_9BACI|nr:bacillithiol transferase BstA [Anaerobacillus alkaliphilus]RXJ04258.1 putative metal-dependent hydrolase [Anaerobacillus alkaliphilus]
MDPRYPIGKLQINDEITKEDIVRWISELEATPELLRKAVEGLTVEQLATPYRPEGWRVDQVVHHLADSHLNAYIRVKLALTEENPLVKVYDEVLWAQLPDNQLPIEVSLQLLLATHARLVTLLNSLQDEDFKRTINHPDNGIVSVEQLIATYAWHGKHHIAHITSLREKMGW